MADENLTKKSPQALREEAILAFWKENNIFEKSLTKNSPKGDFIFYEGPPTANAKPALHHLEARAFKDVIPRYKTMQGYHVPRRAGWDTHGLPVELQIEKKLGFQSKKDIEEYGIAKFNKECKDSVFTYIKDWEDFTDRIGYWVDKKNAYYTFDSRYMESVWNIISEVDKRGLLYKDYKVVPWCPRCGTALASHELAQGYQDIKSLSVYAKFKITNPEKIGLSGDVFILAWTTTPWTLPGNVALAVGKDIDYVKVKNEKDTLILARERAQALGLDMKSIEDIKGGALVGLEYEPLYPFLKTSLEKKGEDFSTAFKVYPANFVTTTDGTGIVHTAVMYGQDDFELGTQIGLPKVHTVDESGHFLQDMDFLSRRFVVDEDVVVDIIKDLAHRELLFKKEKYEHSYPHCWRCKTPLIYYARDSWYIRMSGLRGEMVRENEGINWQPEHIREGRFGEWLRDAKDWAISRERYWGTPLPIWINAGGDRVVVDSISTLKNLTKKSGNKYFVMRHGQTDHNVRLEWNCDRNTPDSLTELGVKQVQDTAKLFQGSIDIVFISPFNRTKESARLFNEVRKENTQVIEDERLREWFVGQEFNNRPFDKYFKVRNASPDRYTFKTEDGESYTDIIVRAGEFIYDIESKYQGKNILIITHGAVARALELHGDGINFSNLFAQTRNYHDFENSEIREIEFTPLPHNERYEVDLHKPYIDNVVLERDDQTFSRAKEVMDVWFDSGSMPFSQDHYPFDSTLGKSLPYPADFISEAIDQTRGWFYTLHAIGVLMGRGKAYKNVICLGHLLDKDGKKMSKSLGNVVEPFEQIEKFGVDAVRFWMYSVNSSGESKNYDERSVAEINNKIFNLLGNVYTFYSLYRDKDLESKKYKIGDNILDTWINIRLEELIRLTTESLDNYDLFKPTRELRDFVDDLSTWYLRRSRERLKGGDKEAKQTLYHVLKTISKVIAPFAPFTAEDLWQKLKNDGDEESVHLASWPHLEAQPLNENVRHSVLNKMEGVRSIVSKGLEMRQKAGIKIRQPLAKFVIVASELEDEYLEIIKDELNVKDVESGSDFILDTQITGELLNEGIARELIRSIQDLRKEKGLTPEQEIALSIGTNDEGHKIVKKFSKEIKNVVGAKSLDITEDESGEIVIEGITFSLNF